MQVFEYDLRILGGFLNSSSHAQLHYVTSIYYFAQVTLFVPISV